MTSHLLWTGPAFRRAENDHRPAGTFWTSVAPRLALDRVDILNAMFDGLRHLLVH